MENATKALLIAAAVLIAILLISLGIVVMRQGQTAVQDAGSGMDAAAIEQFNGKFVGYEGTHKSTSQVNALLREVLTHNLQEQSNSGTRYVQVIGAGGLTLTQTTGSATNDRLSGNSYYDVSFTYATSGIITKITITKK